MPRWTLPDCDGVADVDTTLANAWMTRFATLVEQRADELTDLDRQIGDADHGSNMARGMRAVTALDPADFPDAAAYLKKAGMTLVSTVGGASGPLYGTFLLRFAGSAPADDTVAAMATAWRAGLDGVLARGRAGVGDKTMVDALQPAVESLEQAGGSLKEALEAAAAAAAAGRDEVTPLVARKGRASYLGERSKDHQDPGATSATILVEALAAVVD